MIRHERGEPRRGEAGVLIDLIVRARCEARMGLHMRRRETWFIEELPGARSDCGPAAKSEHPGSSRETDPVMEFAFSESQRHWYDAAVKFAREELSDPDSVERERRGEFWREGYRRCAPSSASRACPCRRNTAAGARTC